MQSTEKLAEKLFNYIKSRQILVNKAGEFSSQLSELSDIFEPKDQILENILLDMLGVPPDNTEETNACNIANATGKWPDNAFCRDYHIDLILGYQGDWSFQTLLDAAINLEVAK